MNNTNTHDQQEPTPQAWTNYAAAPADTRRPDVPEKHNHRHGAHMWIALDVPAPGCSRHLVIRVGSQSGRPDRRAAVHGNDGRHAPRHGAGEEPSPLNPTSADPGSRP